MTETSVDALTEILPDLLAPLLMGGTVTDPERARRAAEQAIAQYRSGVRGELVTIGQIVAFALTAIDNLRLSMPDTVSMTMKLKLRGNANALNRASLHAVEALDRSRTAADTAWPDVADPAFAEPSATEPAAVPNPVAPPGEMQNRQHWATAMTTVADELRTRAPLVPPVQRRSDQLWAKVLSKVAGELHHSDRPSSHPHLSKADLLRTTIVAGGSSFPNN